MSFSDKMRHGLGAEGARLEVNLDEERIAPGETLSGTVRITGGTKSAQVEAITVRIIQATRRWTDRDGQHVSEQDAQALADRSRLTAAWDRRPIQQQRFSVDRVVETGSEERISFQLALPADSLQTTASCTYTINVQADVKGQIDPTANARLTVG